MEKNLFNIALMKSHPCVLFKTVGYDVKVRVTRKVAKLSSFELEK